MKTTLLRYNVLIRKEGKHFIADVPTLGISDFGTTLQQAKKHIQAAISCHIEGLIKTNTEIPNPDVYELYLTQTEVSVPHTVKMAF